MDNLKDTNLNHYLSDYLPIYYKRLFPFSLYYRWLNYGGVDKTYFSNREFSFTVENDVYIRYLSYMNQSELEKQISQKIPYKIDIGAVYNFRPKDRFTVANFIPLSKELVFDIDISDYNEVRTCCKESDMCEKCWPLMVIAIKILDIGLREDFGFEHILWIYSGRRGIHCWVCDVLARKLDKNVRSAIAEYFTIVIGGENMLRKVELEDPIHPSISRSFNIIKNYFEKLMLIDQDILGTPTACDKILKVDFSSKHLRKLVKRELESQTKSMSSIDKWNIMSKIVSRETSKGKYQKSSKCRQEIMLQYCYPRLDVNVTTGLNHLLKSPFSVHPKTGRVCVPIDIENIDEFKPLKVPTIDLLCDEINAYEMSSKDEDAIIEDMENNVDDSTGNQPKKLKNFKKTSLYPSIQTFEKFVQNLEASWKGKLLEQSDIKCEF
ncbi:unnamed protein product [Gordionus sp. m RMFG-2023]